MIISYFKQYLIRVFMDFLRVQLSYPDLHYFCWYRSLARCIRRARSAGLLRVEAM